MSDLDAQPDNRMKVGHVSAAHGIRGEVKIRSYTEHARDIVAYGPIRDENGREITLADIRPVKGGFVVARVAGISDRSAAEALIGTGLFVERAHLPEPEPDEWYYSDLIGLSAHTPEGEGLGRIIAVHDFGAGDIIEVDPEDGRPSVMIPFTREHVLDVLMPQRRIIVRPPEEIEEQPEAD